MYHKGGLEPCRPGGPGRPKFPLSPLRPSGPVIPWKPGGPGNPVKPSERRGQKVRHVKIKVERGTARKQQLIID